MLALIISMILKIKKINNKILTHELKGNNFDT